MPRILGLVSLFAQLLLQLDVVSLYLLELGASEHFRVLANLSIHKSEQLTHLERYIEQLLVDELARIVLSILFMDLFQVAFQVSELILVSRRAHG